MKNLKPRKTTIENKGHPEWGTFGIYEDCGGGYYEIHGRGGSRILFKSEAEKFWKVSE